MAEASEHILSVEGLDVSYGGVQAVRGVSLDVAPGEIVGIVGESGSGKSSVLRATAGLLGRAGSVTGGRIAYGGRDVSRLTRREMNALRGGGIAYVFQDPMASLDPLYRIGTQFDECIRAHGTAQGVAVRALECDLLAEMGFDDAERVLASYPHELSGGMCQRVVLAMSVACDSALLLADELTSQLQVSSLLLRIREQRGCAILIVSHNIAAIAQVADRIGVMKGGRLVETGDREQVLHAPQHPYTKALIAAIPRGDGTLSQVIETSGGGNDVA